MADSTFTIFYSWQSDLPNSTTRGLIESSIEAAIRSLRNTVSVYADRDTQGVTGSPDIVQTIFSKIDECDVFVADVTSVATYHPLDKDGNETDRLKAMPIKISSRFLCCKCTNPRTPETKKKKQIISTDKNERICGKKCDTSVRAAKLYKILLKPKRVWILAMPKCRASCCTHLTAWI